MRSFHRPVLQTLTAFVLLGGVAQAQQVPPAAAGAAGAANVGRIQQEAPAQQPSLAEPSSAAISVRPAPLVAAPAGAENVKFVLRTLTLDGVRVYHGAALDPYYQQLIGKQITLADLYRVANVLTVKYRNDGYVLTQVVVPPQTIAGGNVHLRVVEGYIDNIEVRGFDRPRAAQLIREYADKVHGDGEALNIKDLEHAMLIINDLPGVSAQGVLSPSPNRVGAADLLVTYERKDYNAQVGVDNYGSKFIGPWETSAALSLNSVFGMNERITGQVVYAPGQGLKDELAYGGLDWTQPILEDGTTLEAFGSDTYTRPDYLLRSFDIRGDAQLVGLRINHPFIRTRDLTLTDRFTVDYNDVTTQENIAPTLRDRIRTARFGGRVEFNDTVLTAAHSFVDLEAAHGLDIFGARSDDATNVSHFGAKPDFTKFTGEAQRLQVILPDVNVLLGVIGQYSPSTLYTAEQLGIGGINYGRGYDPSQLVGDSGYAGKAELQWNNPLKAPALSRFIANYQLYSFLDGGRVFNHSATTSAEARASLVSTGFGLRSDFQSGTSGNIMASFPLTRGIESEDDKHDIRIQGALNQKF